MGIFNKKQSGSEGRARPRAVSGTFSNPRYAYYQNRSSSEKEDPRRLTGKNKPVNKMPRRVVRNLPALTAVIIIGLSFIYMTLLGDHAKVKILDEKSPGSTLLQELKVYEEAASTILASSPLNKSKFSVDSNALARELEEQFPELSGVTVVIPVIGSQPTFLIKPIRPSFILSSNHGSYLINEFGTAVAETDNINNIGSLNLTSVVDKSDLTIERNKAVLSGEQTAFINTVIAQLKEKKVAVSNLTIPVSAYDLELRMPGKPFYVRFNMLEDPRQQIGSYLAVQKEIDDGKINPQSYIDVRVEERAYIK